MKKWKRAVTGILAVSVLTAGLALPGIAGAAATDQTETSKTQFKNGAVIPVSQSEAARLAAREKALSQYYRKHYFYRMDKALTGDYFQHVKAFTRDMETLVGEYFIAKDKSCVFRRFPESGNIELLEGTTEKLLKKVEIYRAGAIIPLKGKGKVLIRVPGNLPYDLTLTSLTENVATIQEENGQLSITGNARGYADILAEVEIGGFVKTQKLRFAVMDERDIAAYEARQTYVPVYVGMSWGWGWWDHPRHHHHHRPGPPPHHHEPHCSAVFFVYWPENVSDLFQLYSNFFVYFLGIR